MNTPRGSPACCDEKSLHGATESMHHNKRPSATKNNNNFFKCKLHGFLTVYPEVPWDSTTNLAEQDVFNKFLRETQKPSTWIRHSKPPIQAVTVSTWDFCALTFNDTLSLQSWPLWLKQNKTNKRPTAQTSLAMLQEEQVVVSLLLPGKVRTCLTGARIPLEVTVVI